MQTSHKQQYATMAASFKILCYIGSVIHLKPLKMAIHRSVIGTFNKSMGDVTFTNWKGLKVAKQKVPARNTSNSFAQSGQRAKFALLAVLAGVLGGAVRIGFKTSAVNKTEQNVFTSKNFPLVTLDAQGVASVDFSRLELSAGSVEGVANLIGTANVASGEITVSWLDNSNGASGLPSDKITIAVINEATMQTHIFTPQNTRDNPGAIVQVQNMTAANKGDFRVYAFFKRASSTATSPTATDVVS